MHYQMYGSNNLPELARRTHLPASEVAAMEVVAQVLPFRTNNYVVDQLIDWNRVPEDPIFQLTFPQKEMLSPVHFAIVADALEAGKGGPATLRAVTERVRRELNPHPEGQLSHNVPALDGQPVQGVQRKYRNTCLVFPAPGQTCHAYCTFCFRWAQFVGLPDLRFATDESMRFLAYLRREPEITDVLVTGGDPMIMRTKVLARYLEPLLGPDLEHVQSIRIGSKSLSYWPYRFLTDPDADELLRLFERVVKSGKHLAFMAHFNHWQELRTDAVRAAITRIRGTGAQIRTQSPLVAHINDDTSVWTRMWREQVRLGCVPYYMFVERDTGANRYFKVPLAQAVRIFSQAFRSTSGLVHTVRGPVMSAFPGKVVIEGVAEVLGEPVFVLSFVQARNPAWVHRPFLAQLNTEACWLTELKPAFGDRSFFWESELPASRAQCAAPRMSALAA